MPGETTDARKRRLEREHDAILADGDRCGICLPGDYCPTTGQIHEPIEPDCD